MKDLSVDFYSYCHNAMNLINPNFMNYRLPNNGGSIFNPASNPNQAPVLSEAEENALALEQQLQNAKDEQGFIGKTWDGIKGFFGAKTSSKKAEEAIKKYKNGEISLEDAQNTIDKYKTKQKGAADVFSNVVTGLATVGIIAASGIATGGLSLAVLGAGALAGGAVKASLKTIDRATNNKEGDALDAKQIVKDGLSGAITGTVTVATSGVANTVTALGSSAKEAAKIGITNGVKSGAISGAASGAGNYVLDAAFEDDVKFSAEGLIGAAVSNAAAGALAGGITGGITNVRAYNNIPSFSNGTNAGNYTAIGGGGKIIEIDTAGNILNLPPSNGGAMAALPSGYADIITITAPNPSIAAIPEFVC